MQRLVSMKRALTSASGSGMDVSVRRNGVGCRVCTFLLVELGVEGQGDFGAADAHQLALVCLDTSELADHLSEHVVGTSAYRVNICGDEMMNSENVGHLDV